MSDLGSDLGFSAIRCALRTLRNMRTKETADELREVDVILGRKTNRCLMQLHWHQDRHTCLVVGHSSAARQLPCRP